MFSDLKSSERPREKLQRYGARRLSDGELVQILIGSGSGSYNLGRIAKKTLKLIRDTQAELTCESLMKIAGIGLAKSCQIVALFELASRYPIRRTSRRIDTIQSIVDQLPQAVRPSVVMFTVDGAGYLINQRFHVLSSSLDVTQLTRQAVRDACMDDALSVAIVIQTNSTTIAPTMLALQAAREIKQVGRVVGIQLKDMIINNGRDYRSVLESHDV